jgi:hypothetical protein
MLPAILASICFSVVSKRRDDAARMLLSDAGSTPEGRANTSSAGWTTLLAGVIADCHCASVVRLPGAL